MWIRRLLISAPLAVIVIFLCSYLIARPYFWQKTEQLTIASIGEPERLNPILSTTTSAAIIEYFVFDSLLELDENAQIKPSLAERYELKQTSTLYFQTPADAQRALDAILAHRADWKEISLVRAHRDQDAVVLRLDRPGTAYRESVLRWVHPLRPLKFQRWQAIIKTEPTAPADGLNSKAIIKFLDQISPRPPQKPRIVYAWPNTSRSFEIYTVGADNRFITSLRKQIAEHLGLAVTSQPRAADGSGSAHASVLFRFDRDFQSQDEPEITFYLRKNVRWHDGQPFTAADVRFTYEKLMDEKVASPRRSDFELIKFLKVLDPYTVRVVYKEPYSPCLYSWTMDIIPQHILKHEPDLRSPTRTNFDRRPIGTGAFKLAEWKTDQHIILVRNDDYWQGRPHLPKIAYRIIPDPTVSQLEFATGGFDYTGLEPHQVGRFKRDPAYQVFSGLSNAYAYIAWNLRRPYFKDRRVRLALAHAVDVNAIIKYVMYGHARPCNGVYAPVTPWWNPDIKPIEYDPAKARKLLEEAGWRDTDGDGILDKDGVPFRFTLITNNGNIVRSDIAVLVQRYLRQVGVDVKINLYEWAVFIKNYIDPRNYDACILGWALGFDQDLYQLWHSSQVKAPALNFVSYANPEVDRLIEKARTEFDFEKIRQYCFRIAELIYADQPYLFLFYPESNAAMPRGLYRVRRPGPDGTWIDEPIRRTKLGFTIYQKWWIRQRPNLIP